VSRPQYPGDNGSSECQSEPAVAQRGA
jgi:hypothetical protein